MNDDSSRKDLITLILTMSFIVALLVGLKLVDQKNGMVGILGEKLFKSII